MTGKGQGGRRVGCACNRGGGTRQGGEGGEAEKGGVPNDINQREGQGARTGQRRWAW